MELETGKRAEGAIASLSSFVTKCGMGLGGALPGYILAAAGFQKDAAVQTETVKSAIILCCTWIPFVLAIVAAALIITLYPLTKEKLEEQNRKNLNQIYSINCITQAATELPGLLCFCSVFIGRAVII